MNVQNFEELDSTNLYAKNHIDSLLDRTIVVAKRQNLGRGRLQRAWLDLGGDNLYMTIVLKPQVKNLETYANLTQYLSVILCKVLEGYNLVPQIKWPNDVLINGKKIAGILSEAIVCGGVVKGVVLGIGVNLNVEKENLKLVTDKEVTSLNLEISKAVDLNLFREDLCQMFFEDYEQFLSQGFEFIKEDYIKRIDFFGKEITVKGFNSVTVGVAKSVNSKGELILEHDSKELVLNIGDIL